jgi:hypothetical protein
VDDTDIVCRLEVKSNNQSRRTGTKVYNRCMPAWRWLAFILALVIVAGLWPAAVLLGPHFGQVPREMQGSLPQQVLTPNEQAAQAAAGLLIKPTYMLLTLLLIVGLVGQAADMRALQWG